MKRTILLLISICSISTAFSQSISPGIRIGANLSDWNVTGASGTGLKTLSLTNPEIGVFVNFKTSRSFSVEPGVIFTTAGATFKYDADETDFNLTYLQVPVLAKYNLSKRFTLFAGPQVGFLLKATAKTGANDKEDAKTLFKKSDVEVSTGMQYNFPIGISMGLKYATGLTAIYSTADEKIKNYSFGVNLAYQFRAAKRN